MHTQVCAGRSSELSLRGQPEMALRLMQTWREDLDFEGGHSPGHKVTTMEPGAGPLLS